MLTTLVLFVLACYGATNGITASRLFRPIRDAASRIPGVGNTLGHFMQCPMCVGFYVGIFWYYAGLIAFPVSDVCGVLAAGCISSGACWILRVMLARLGEDNL